jgi:O-antigen/teichoic acid export membrane protein
MTGRWRRYRGAHVAPRDQRVRSADGQLNAGPPVAAGLVESAQPATAATVAADGPAAADIAVAALPPTMGSVLPTSAGPEALPGGAGIAVLEAEDPDVVRAAPPVLGRAMGKGLAWSLLNNIIGRAGNFLSGIVIVRILSPEQYGTYAVGMVVLSVLLSMNELGVSVAVVQRKGSVDEIAPTVMTLSVLSSLVLAVAAFFAAPSVASLLDAPEATNLIRLLLVGVLIDGLVAVPNALITRAFAQRVRLRIDLLAFVIGTPLTIGLAMGGLGAWSLGWGAVTGNVITGVLAVLWAPARYRPGWSRSVAAELLRFGLPLAGASLLLFAMLNVDYIVVGHMLGAVQLGVYLLAFNLCSWPITVISTAIRRVSLSAFARMHETGDASGEGFQRTVALVMAMTLPMCVLLAGFAGPVIEFLYGSKWSAAAAPLRYLAVLTAARIAVELTYDYLAAIGRTRSSLWLHAIWLAALIPALTFGASLRGVTGVAMGHAVVSVVVLLPMLAVLLHRAGVSLTRTIATMAPVLLGSALVAAMVIGFELTLHGVLPKLTVGVAACLIVYGLAVWPMRHTARAMWNMAG